MIEVKSPREVRIGSVTMNIVDAVRNYPDRSAEIHDAFDVWWIAHCQATDEENARLWDVAREAERDRDAKVEIAQQSVSAAIARAKTAETLQQTHWQLTQQLMAGDSAAAVAVLRELRALELVGAKASIEAQLLALGGP